MAKSLFGTPITSVCVVPTTKQYGGDMALLNTLMKNYVGLLDTTSNIIKQFFPVITVNVSTAADIDASLKLSPALFTRLSWAQRNKGTKFNATLFAHLSQLRDIYIEYRMDWKKDPVLRIIAW